MPSRAQLEAGRPWTASPAPARFASGLLALLAVLAFGLRDRSAAFPSIAFPWMPDGATVYDALNE
ncbi:hypothetical protein [Streptomyces sp. SudanB25_2051]|uniref:hypothetical protein n=1 Tax=Streptomyces sp. SudanB25_2051 TaxID=3035275 RepID=UPI003F55C73B